jgi:FlaA1/EpsC-like NDP-sugar epimerase
MLKNLANLALDLPRSFKRVLVMGVDISLCLLTVWFAYFLRLDYFVPLSGRALWVGLASVAIALPIFISFGLYRAIFRYVGLAAFVTIVKAVAVYGLIFATIITVVSFNEVPRTVGLMQPLLLLIGVSASRLLARFWLGGLYLSRIKLAMRPGVLIYGSGSAGRQLAAAMVNSPEMQVMGFLDDDTRLHGRVLNGNHIYNPGKINALAQRLNVSTVLLALPSVNRHRRNQIIEGLIQAKLSVRTLPSVADLAQGKVTAADIRELDIDDLLGRDAVAPDLELLSLNITGKTVLVTGAGGSIGSELCRQIVQQKPQTLLLVELNELALYSIHHELESKLKVDSNQQSNAVTDAAIGAITDADENNSDKSDNKSNHADLKIKLVPLLASVCDGARMRQIIETLQPHTIYHAAAYKHVPMVEHNPIEGVVNNVWGTRTVALAAQACGVPDMVLISTDKAVRPTNVMGASKRLAEMVLQGLADLPSSTRFTMVRFGNVLGSSGSVVPRFKQQVRSGGPVTITHPDITRYFMTIPEAAQLVIQAGAMSRRDLSSDGSNNGSNHKNTNGRVYVLDMGEPVKIIDLARRTIELSGLTLRDEQNPDGDIELMVTGLRPGEKLFEELLIGDNPQTTDHPRIMQANEAHLPWTELETELAKLDVAIKQNDVQAVRAQLEHLVVGYKPNSPIVDWLYLSKNAR